MLTLLTVFTPKLIATASNRDRDPDLAEVAPGGDDVVRNAVKQNGACL